MGNRKRLPDTVQWTPLRQTCACVIDWGWNSQAGPPQAFISWCMRMVEAVCPRHGKERLTALMTPGIVVEIRDPSTAVMFHARKATGQDVALGGRLTGELLDLREKVTGDPQVVLAAMPANYRNWLWNNGYEPVQAWKEQRLTDIVLNRGTKAMGSEVLASIPEQPVIDCPVCQFSAVSGGIRCVCGHDWSCHPTAAGGSEPCSHCACQDMKDRVVTS